MNLTHSNSNGLVTACMMLVLALSISTGAAMASDRPANLPDGFRFIGHYKLKSKLRVEHGTSTPVVISPLIYRVFSDGIDVRVYSMGSGDESFTNYEIYRSDGIGVTRRSGEIDVVAGVQAHTTKGEMVRQLSVTRTSLTMVKMPPRSHRVLVTRALVVNAAPASEIQKTPPPVTRP